MQRLIVVGIHTEVGKTAVAAVLAKALNAFYWKPVQCGLPSDADWVERYIPGRILPTQFTLQTPSSPHLAARKEGIRIAARDLRPPEIDHSLIIEGTGGIFAPLNETEVWLDAAIHWNAHWILVHRHYLGSLNHFLLTVAALRQRAISLLGVVFNGEGDPMTENMLLEKAASCCLGRLKEKEVFSLQRIGELSEIWQPALCQALGM
jgi:dethiobiotin synthetase